MRAVTGLVLPDAARLADQVLFERGLGWFAHGFRRRAFDAEFFARTGSTGAPVWAIGAGVNLAVRREVFQRLGYFDERLGAGASSYSEDSELLYRILADGGECRYRPDAVVRHDHRAEMRELERQVHDYVRGHVSALFVQFARSRDRGNLRRAFVTMPAHFLRRLPVRPRSTTACGGRSEPRCAATDAGCCSAGWAFRAPTTAKAPLSRFLRQNPYPHPHTDGLFYREKMRAIHRVAPDAPVEDVLEVGGGTSGLTALLYPGAKVVNLDADASAAESPVNRVERTTFVLGDATQLPFPDARFGAVTMFDLLKHVADDAAAIAEARRVLRPGGFMLGQHAERDLALPLPPRAPHARPDRGGAVRALGPRAPRLFRRRADALDRGRPGGDGDVHQPGHVDRPRHRLLFGCRSAFVAFWAHSPSPLPGAVTCCTSRTHRARRLLPAGGRFSDRPSDAPSVSRH